ncbi:MAG: acetyl-CoA carboxylase, carboxyltransferase subunit beta [bacterium]|nr:acetyl-CoA carboxylase, carboxyltransferase subunit beta [bacterium]
MSLRDWFAARSQSRLVDTEREKREIADGLWSKCVACQEPLFTKDLMANLQVCPLCGQHHRVEARERIHQLADPGSFRERHTELRSVDPLGFVDTRPYPQRLADARARAGDHDSIIVGTATIHDRPVMLAVMDFAFMGGSMGSVTGEKFTRAVEDCVRERLSLVVVASSGGARMQEGILSLMQMAKTSVAISRLAQAGLLYISVLTDPTTGGVSASFVTQADIIVAEPGATFGFAGRRVIEATIRQKAPADFQTAEWVLRHGLIDQIVPRPRLRDTLGELIDLHVQRIPVPTRPSGHAL